MTFYLQEISHMGIKTIPPQINKSEIEFAAKDGVILFGLKGIKNVGLAALQEIIKEREKKPFVDLLDFCTRVDLRTSNKRVIESLISAGAMDDLPGNRAQKTNELDKIMTIANREKELARTGQMQLFGSRVKNSHQQDLYTFQPCDEWSSKEKLTKEKEIVGFYLSSHPLEEHKNTINMLDCKNFAQAHEKIKNFKGRQEPIVVCCGLKQSYREITTKKGAQMAFAQFEDLSGTCEAVIFPRVFKRVEQWLDTHDVFIIKGALDSTSEKKCKIKVNELVPVELLFDQWPSIERCTIKLPQSFDQSIIDQISQFIKAGKTSLSFSFHENGEKLLLKTRKRIFCDKSVVDRLKQAGVTVSLGL
jgi:DNA polymerase-3 subunit alpha